MITSDLWWPEEQRKASSFTTLEPLRLMSLEETLVFCQMCAKEEMGRKLIFTKSFCQTQDISAPHMVNVTKGNPQVKELGPTLTLKFTISKLHNLFFSGEHVLLCHK